MSLLFQPGTIGKMELKNRIIQSAMHLGQPIDTEIEFYRQVAVGGAAAITFVAGVSLQGGMFNMPILTETFEPHMRKLVEQVHKPNSRVIVQLFHAGRNGRKGLMGSPELEPVAPSPVPSPLFRYTPVEMTSEDIKTAVEQFAQAARNCKNWGVDAVEISCSAGYLLTQFMSTQTNQRTDCYGGSEENRMRFPLEVIAAVRAAVGTDFTVTVRLSGGDMLGGYSMEMVQRLVQTIPKGQVDGFSVTGGWHESPIPQIDGHVPKGGWACLAGAIKRITDLPVVACNRINDRETAEGILDAGLSDFVGCARAFLADHDFGESIRTGKPYTKCIACNKGCIQRLFQLEGAQCVLNPELAPTPAPHAAQPHRMMVAGGGPAGMWAAKRLAEAGHTVILCCAEEELGGRVRLAAEPKHKADLMGLIEKLESEMQICDVEVRRNTTVTDTLLELERPEVLVDATGGVPIHPNIPGLDSISVCHAEDVLSGDSKVIQRLLSGNTVILGGGLVGVETALYLAEHGYYGHSLEEFVHSIPSSQVKDLVGSPMNITILEMKDRIGEEYGAVGKLYLEDLKRYGVKGMTKCTAVRVEDGHIIYKSNGENEEKIPVNQLILAVGYRTGSGTLAKQAEKLGITYFAVGGATAPGMIGEAILSGMSATEKIV